MPKSTKLLKCLPIIVTIRIGRRLPDSSDGRLHEHEDAWAFLTSSAPTERFDSAVCYDSSWKAWEKQSYCILTGALQCLFTSHGSLTPIIKLLTVIWFIIDVISRIWKFLTQTFEKAYNWKYYNELKIYSYPILLLRNSVCIH